MALKKISSRAPDVPPIEAEIESASLSHSTALSAAHIACVAHGGGKGEGRRGRGG